MQKQVTNSALLHRQCLITLLIAVVLVVACSSSVPAQQPVPPPSHVWISLGFSSIDPAPVDWDWVAKACTEHSLATLIAECPSKISGIIVPVFDSASCGYVTTVAPFVGRNSNAISNQRALALLISRCHAAGIPVYLSVDMFRWSKEGASNTGASIFNKYPGWEELPAPSDTNTPPPTRYASPFNDQVIGAIGSVVREIAVRFPEASGIVLNNRLSNEDILGFSPQARASSVLSISVDPADLGITNTADETIDKEKMQWSEWRCAQLNDRLTKISEEYRAAKPGGSVLAVGSADYYTMTSFNEVRTGQDWSSWTSPSVDRVLVEGRWLPQYSDLNTYCTVLAADLPSSPPRVPFSSGSNLRGGETYDMDWFSIKERMPAAETCGFMARSNDDLERVCSIVRGDMIDSQATPIQVGQPMPEWTLSDVAGTNWSSKSLLGAMSVALLLTPSIASLPSAGTLPLSLKLFAVYPVRRNIGAATNYTQLVDPNSQILHVVAGRSAAIIVDRAGFVRSILTTGDVCNRVMMAADPTPTLAVGSPAPAFSVPDFNGNMISSTFWRGRKNLLLTFFPKCFTGGCALHLASLRDTKSLFDRANTVIVAVSVDPADMQLAFAHRHGLNFTLVPDTGRNVCVLYGACTNVSQLAERQSVLIDKEGVVRIIDRNINVGTHGTDMLEEMRECGLITR